MAKEKGATIRFVYGIFFSLLSVFVGILFIKQTWAIYRSAPQSPFSVESISLHFHQIALPVWLWVAAVAGNILLSLLFPEQEKRPKAYRDTALALSRVKSSLCLEGEVLERAKKAGKKHENFRKAVYAVCIVIMLALAVVCFCSLLGVAYLPVIEKEFFAGHDGMVDKLVQCAVLSILALLAGCVAAELNARSRDSERKVYLQAKADALKGDNEKKSKWLAFIQKATSILYFQDKDAEKALDEEAEKAVAEPQIPVKKQKAKKEKKQCKKCKTTGVWLARTVIFALAILLLFVGVQNGGMKEMFLKAINICTQCIGLG
jgi:hypothetical protein